MDEAKEVAKSESKPESTPRPTGVGGSAHGLNGPMPEDLHGFNWGAFFLSWIWGIAHNTWIALVALVLSFFTFIPFIGPIALLAFNIYLGIKGNELAWQNRKFKDVAQFKAVQKAWMFWGLTLFVLSVVLGIVAAVFLAMNGFLPNMDSDIQIQSY